MRGSGEGEPPKSPLNVHEPAGSSLHLLTHTLGGRPGPGYMYATALLMLVSRPGSLP